MKEPVQTYPMDKIEIQRKFFFRVAVLLLLSAVSLIAVIPAILMDKSATSLPIQAAIGAFIGALLHLFLAYWFGIRLKRRSRMIRNEALILSAVGFFFLGFMMLDGAYAFLEDARFVSIGMSICAICDFAASLASVFALVLLRIKKKKQQVDYFLLTAMLFQNLYLNPSLKIWVS